MTTILFCNDVLQPSQVDHAFADEAESALKTGFEIALLDFEKLNGGRTEAALRRVRSIQESVVYRGWVLRPAIYVQLFDSLLERGANLVNTAQQYRHCHYLPESYAAIARQTPQTVWLPLVGEIDFDEIRAKLEIFGDKPLIVKDYVKSRKHEWLRSCFIPRANDAAEVERVVRNFVEGQGDGLNEGLVFREFVPLRSVGTHEKSGAPISQEFRLWFWKNELLYWSTYWEGGEYADESPPLDKFEELAREVHSNFFSMDVAQTQSGQWIVIELGDGQVAGLPSSNDIAPFYEKLAQQ